MYVTTAVAASHFTQASRQGIEEFSLEQIEPGWTWLWAISVGLLLTSCFGWQGYPLMAAMSLDFLSLVTLRLFLACFPRASTNISVAKERESIFPTMLIFIGLVLMAILLVAVSRDILHYTFG